jgi:hypothetical protein
MVCKVGTAKRALAATSRRPRVGARPSIRGQSLVEIGLGADFPTVGSVDFLPRFPQPPTRLRRTDLIAGE